MQSQFDIRSPQSTFGDYDSDSIMHYFACAFSKCTGQGGNPTCNCLANNCITMQVVSQYAAQQCKIGLQNHLSAMDQRAMAFMYGWKFLYAKPASVANGSFQQPYQTMSQAVAGSANSTLWMGPGTYSAAGMTISTPMTLGAAIADLQLQSDGSLGPSSSGYATLK